MGKSGAFRAASAAAAIAVVGAPAVAADQFDLICKSDKSQERYRIDLAAGEWCRGDCQGTAKIAGVTSTHLTLVDEDQPFTVGGLKSFLTIDRLTGELYDSVIFRNPPMVYRTDGVCEPAPFSGFGAEKAKF